MSRFDNFHRQHENPFGTEPVKVVGAILKYQQSGTALELGAGDGRDALFLAANGFEVMTGFSNEGELYTLIGKY